jgi:hypothetical protein
MGMIYLRGNTFSVKCCRNGKPYRESSHSGKEGEAKKLLKKREGEIVGGRFQGHASRCRHESHQEVYRGPA